MTFKKYLIEYLNAIFYKNKWTTNDSLCFWSSCLEDTLSLPSCSFSLNFFDLMRCADVHETLSLFCFRNLYGFINKQMDHENTFVPLNCTITCDYDLDGLRRCYIDLTSGLSPIKSVSTNTLTSCITFHAAT